jgi:hypothetical protein
MADLRVDIAAEFTGKKAFDKADKATGSLNKSVLRLARTFGPAVLGAAVIKFGKDAAQAFIEDQKQATRLAVAVKNLGLELSNPAISSYVDNLSKASGVADTQLRPAFQALLTTTGSVTESQKLLQLAIDTSVGSGVELTQVAQDLASAYVGKTKALGKYNLGLTQAELKTAKFTDLQQKLNDQYKGANAAFLNTYAGKMQALGVAAGEASELIGGALIDSLMSLSGSTTLQDLITQIDDLANKTVGWIDQLTEGVLIVKAIAENANGMGILGLIINKDQLSRDIQAAQVDAYNKMLRRNKDKAFAGVVTPAQSAAEKKAQADAAKRAKDIAAAQEKQTKELKKQAALKKAGTVFDLAQIQIIAALKGKITEDDKIRLQAQAAILNGNDVLASALTKQVLMAQDESGKLYQYFLSIGDAKIKNPFAFLDDWIIQFQNKLNNIKFPVAPTSGAVVGFTPEYILPQGPKVGDPNFIGPVPIIPPTNVTTLPITTAQGYAGAGSTAMAERQQYIEIKVTGEGDLTNAIAKSLQNQSLSSGNAAYINRRTGGFE